MWAGLEPALAHCPIGCQPSCLPPPPSMLVFQLAYPQTWGPVVLDPWASLCLPLPSFTDLLGGWRRDLQRI